jgi:hypothetical protein
MIVCDNLVTIGMAVGVVVQGGQAGKINQHVHPVDKVPLAVYAETRFASYGVATCVPLLAAALQCEIGVLQVLEPEEGNTGLVGKVKIMGTFGHYLGDYS